METKSQVRPDGPGVHYGPLAVSAVGTMIAAAAFVALIVAGVTAADLFPATSGPTEALQDRRIWAATRAWANPLGIIGLAVLFAGAVPYALSNIHKTISYRRDAMATALPAILSKASQS